ncbi:hypothetical protein NG798_25650 [Ancylothrix sp. C2]|uniref:hypothetical protein n=1 Tax=Ancylothrix sp. D3o TaxID=2953691 RepID=UPI0021BB5292|nr:hypothetical protein [Ancylothrix sp. D3o]MCT7953186.1 hypothetical protein [Ancylothrix sp. D3o]
MIFPAPNDVMGPVDFMKPMDLGVCGTPRVLGWGETDGCLGAGGSVRGRWIFRSR